MLTAQNPPPLIRWAGSKKRILPEIVRSIPIYDGKYIEPFAGSACLFFRLNPDQACLNDLNRRLINFYRVAAEYPAAVYDCFANIERTRERFNEIRSLDDDLLDPVTGAAFFFFLNRNCFNGIYRVNKSGRFNVPFSDSRVAPYPTRDRFIESAHSLSRISLESVDFEVFCDNVCSAGDFVYLDPPYYIPEVRIFREYNQTDFTETDTHRLVGLLERMTARGARFLLSYPKGNLTDQLSDRWYSREIRARRSIAGNSSARKTEKEVLLANYDLA